MSLATNKIILANAASNSAGAYFQQTSLAVTTAGTAIPAGVWALYGQAVLSTGNVTVQINTNGDGNLSNATWQNLASVNTVIPVFISDGVNVQGKAATSNQTIVLIGTNGGQSATQSSYATT
jgi:hypothetical protein